MQAVVFVYACDEVIMLEVYVCIRAKLLGIGR
jgi:hypothetical protein